MITFGENKTKGGGTVENIDELIDIILRLFYETDAYNYIDIEYRKTQDLGQKVSRVQAKVRNNIVNLFKSKEKKEKLPTQEEILQRLEELNTQEAYVLCDYIMSNPSGERDYRREDILIEVLLKYTTRDAFFNSLLDFYSMVKVLDELGIPEKADFIKSVLEKVHKKFFSKVVTLTIDRKQEVLVIQKLVGGEIVDILSLK